MEDYMNNIQKINTTTFRQNKIVDAIIGDEKQEKFFPRLKLKKWENEVNFSVGIIDDEPDLDSVVKEKDEVVEWDKGNIIAKFYSLDNPFPNDYYKPMHNPEDGAFEMNITLKEKPDTNVVNLSIHTKGLKFHYQPFLTEEEKLAMKVKRPLNVEGSYAVYHKNKKDNQYKTGKFLHIYRPQVEDSAGNKVWGELKIDKDEGIMSVTIPQEFIDNAVYPIQHATGATFGYTTEGGSTTDDIDDKVIGGRATGAVGEVTKMTAYVSYLENDDVAKCALYTRTSDTAATLLTNGVTNVTTSGASGLLLKDFTFSTNPTIEAVDYFLLITGDSSNKNAPEIASDSGGSDTGFGKNNVYADGFPSSITGGTSSDVLYSIYATYTPAPTFNPAFAHRRLLL